MGIGRVLIMKFFIYYNNGNFESTDKLNVTLLHMIEMGVIKIMVDCENEKAWIRNEEGIAKEITVPKVSGL